MSDLYVYKLLKMIKERKQKLTVSRGSQVWKY